MLVKAADDYVRLRRIGGFKYHIQEMLLRSFVRFASERGDAHLKIETVIDWAAQAPSPVQRESRLRIVIAFARHCRAEDSAHEIPPAGVFGTGRHRRPVAYIFSPDEISRILVGALALPPKASLRPYTYYTLFGLLAATGLRIGEALRLQFDEITPDGLLIRETKFRKSRLVPIHVSTVEALQKYISLRRRIGGNDGHIFVGMNGQPLRPSLAQHAFHEVIVAAGLSAARHGRCPRLHDMRHTWAVRALESSPSRTGQIDRHTRAVMTYLGHSKVASSFWYLHSTPALMNRIADACAKQEQGEKS